MKKLFFNTRNLLSCKVAAALELTNRLVFEGGQPENFKALRGQELNAEASPNAKDFDAPNAREDKENPEGRNAIIGQSVMMLKKYQFEPDKANRDQLHELDDKIMDARKAEFGLKSDGGNPEKMIPYTDQEKKDAADALKTKLDEVRTLYTEDGKLKPSPLKVIDIETTDSELARNQLRQAAMKWVELNPEKPGDTDDLKNNRQWLKEAIRLSALSETGEMSRQGLAAMKGQFPGWDNADHLQKLEVDSKDPDKVLNNTANKVMTAEWVKAQLDAARANTPAPNPPPAPVKPTPAPPVTPPPVPVKPTPAPPVTPPPAPRKPETKENADVAKRTKELTDQGFVIDNPPAKVGETTYAKLGEQRMEITYNADGTYNSKLLTLKANDPKTSEVSDLKNMKAADLKAKLDGLDRDKGKQMLEDLRHLPKHNLTVTDLDATTDKEYVDKGYTQKVVVKDYAYQNDDKSWTPKFNGTFYLKLDDATGMYGGKTKGGGSGLELPPSKNNPEEFMKAIMPMVYGKKTLDNEKPEQE